MITLRDYRDSDYGDLLAIHKASGLPYELPDLASFSLRAVIENSHGVDTALLLRPTAEVFLLAGQHRWPEGLERIRVLEHGVTPIARDLGLTDVYCNLPPQIEQRFGRLLRRRGWHKMLWPQYVRQIR